MSTSRPARCLFSATSKTPSRPYYRTFHTSLNLRNRKPRIPSVKAAKMGLINVDPKRLFPAYSEDERKALERKYTPEQIKAIEAGEEAIDVKDLNAQGAFRSDIGALDYIDDLSYQKPTIDQKRHYEGPVDPNFRPMEDEDLDNAWDDSMLSVQKESKYVEPPEENCDDDDKIVQYNKERFPNRREVMMIDDRMSTAMGTKGPIPHEQIPDYTAPGLPKRFDSPGSAVEKDVFDDDPHNEIEEEDEQDQDMERKAEDEGKRDPRDPQGNYKQFMEMSGMTLDEILQYKIKLLVQHSVSNQTRLGKVRSMYCLAIAGDKNGRLGIGEAKGETDNIPNQARLEALRNMKYIPRYENRTIYGDIEAKQSAVEVQLMARPPGFGLRCQHLIFEMCRAAGIQDIAARVPRSRNPMNTVKAVYKALLNQRLPDEIAVARGKKMVDVRKVYYGGRV